MNRQIISAKTPCCQITVKADRNDDGSPDLDLSPCQDDDCTLHVCPNCVVVCRNCGCTFCSEHVSLHDGEKWCRLCIAASTPGCDDPHDVEALQGALDAAFYATHPCNDCGQPISATRELCPTCEKLQSMRDDYETEHPELRCPVRE